jgi:membrane protease YdiL (CAAX protease family)
VKPNPVLLRFAAYFSAVVLLACVMSPPLYWAGSALADNGILPFLKGFPFHRYFSRSIQISALVMLWPAFRWIGIRSLGELGIERNPLRWRDLVTGIGIALVPVLALAAGYLACEIYRMKAGLAPAGIFRILTTASAVAVLEEFLFRGVLLGLCLRAMRPVAAACVSSTVFALVHFMRVAKPEIPSPVDWLSGFGQLPQVFSSAPAWPILGWGIISLFLAGLILAFATLRTRSLFLAIGIHSGWILGQQGLQWAAKFRIKPPGVLLPWVGPNVVSGAVPTGLVPVGALLVTAGLAVVYLRYARASLRHS